MPDDPRALARIAQVIGIVDSYGYWPMVRQVFSHAVFRPFEGQPSNAAEIARGLERSHPVLGALEVISREGRALNGGQTTLADCHLGAMVAYFVMSEEGAQSAARLPLSRALVGDGRSAGFRDGDGSGSAARACA